MRKPLSLSSESITASGGGNERVGPVGSPSLRAVELSTPRRPLSAWVPPGGLTTAVVSRRGGGGGGFCACNDAPPRPSTSTTIVAAAIRRARLRLATHAHQMLSSYKRSNGPSISIIETASGGVRIAARNAAITIA